MSFPIVGFIPPYSRGVGLSALFLSLGHLLADQYAGLICFVPTSLLISQFPPVSSFSVQPYESELTLVSKLESLSGDPVLVLLPNAAEPSSLSFDAMKRLDIVILCATLSLQDVYLAKRFIDSWTAHGRDCERILFCSLNQGKSLEGPALATTTVTLSFDEALVQEAENRGKTLQEIRPQAKMTHGLKTLATELKTHWGKISRLAQQHVVVSKDPLKDIEDKVVRRLWETLRRSENMSSGMDSLADQIDRELTTVLAEHNGSGMAVEEKRALLQRITDQVMGLGPLEHFLREEDVNEIMVNGLSSIFVERNGVVTKTAETFVNETQLMVVIERMVAGAGRRVDVSSPLCDVRLKDGSRANVVLPPVSLLGPVITVRRFKPTLLTFDDLINAGSITPDYVAVLRRSVEMRDNIIIAGNTGSGKTTLLNILSGFIDEQERIITLEDAAELQLQKPHVISLETRPANAEGIGHIRMQDLVVNALRMRPDRLIVGECRGVEAIPMLQAMNTGHDGSMTTLHANSALDAVRRLESMVLLGAPQWPVSVIRQQIASGIDLVAYVNRVGSERRLVEMGRLTCVNGEIVMEAV
jgi:pilus assembly protein CpaF